MIDRETVQRIKDAADIVEVVGDYVHLIRRGSNFMGLCPFHNERTPSFSVNRRKNMCYCFSCHKGGSPVNFIMEKEGINYHDALLQLAAKYGIEVREREQTDEEKRLQSEREAMFVANEWAMRTMQKWLEETSEGKDIGLQYFYHRGLTQEAIKEFRLGYSLDKGHALADEAISAGYEIPLLKKLGLLGTPQNKPDGEYDRFRGRVIFPVFNTSGKVVAFGGRDLKGGPAKYINSPESEIYSKSNELYGIYQAKNHITRADKCYLVEGYLDVIGMWQAGLKNVVASSGTALTDGQIAMIHRFTDNVTLIYDGDAAGIKAALRGIDMLLSHKLNVKVLLLPDGHDPDSFSRTLTPEEFRDYFEKHETDIIRFKAQILMKDAGSDPMNRANAIRSVVDSLACISDAIKQKVYIQECARIMGVDEATIAAETQRSKLKLLEKRRLEREKGNIERKYPIVDNQPKTDIKKAPEIETPGLFPLKPLEYEIMRYCIRYGLMDFCESADPEGNLVTLNVAEYIKAELEADDMSLTYPAYADILSAVINMKDEHSHALDSRYAEILPVIEQKRQENFNRIAAMQLEMSSIKKEEEKFEEKVNEFVDSELNAVSVDYAGRYFASCENDEFRSIATEIMTERHVLSKRFQPLGQNAGELKRLSELVPRSIIELKQGVIQMRIAGLRKEMASDEVRNNPERAHQIMSEITSLISLRKEISPSIGDRVISPYK